MEYIPIQTDEVTRTPARKLLLTVTEAQQQLAIGRSHIYRLMERGELESVSIGRSRRIPWVAIEAFIDRRLSEQQTGVNAWEI